MPKTLRAPARSETTRERIYARSDSASAANQSHWRNVQNARRPGLNGRYFLYARGPVPTPSSRWDDCRLGLDAPPWPCPKETSGGTVRRSCRLLRDDRQNDAKNNQRHNQDDDYANWPDHGGQGTLSRYPVMLSGRKDQQQVLPEKDCHGHEARELTER